MSEQFARVPLWLLGRSDVSWAAKVLYGLISRYVGTKGREAWPSIEQLRADMRTGRRNVERWIEELRDAGLLEVVRTGRASTYRLAGGEPEQAPSDAVLGVQADAPEVADQIRQESRISHASSGGSDAPEVADQIRQESRISGARTTSLEEISEDQGRDQGREPRPPPELESDLANRSADVERARLLLLRGYQCRYEAAANDAWFGADRAYRDILTCARWVAANGAGEIEARAERLLDGMFDPRRTRFAEARWNWAWVARDPAEFAAEPTGPREGYIKLQAKPGEYVGDREDFGTADIPPDEPGQRRVNYG